MRKADVIIVAAGKGLRFKAKLPKPLVQFNQKPLLEYSLNVFKQSPMVERIAIVVPEEHLKLFERFKRRFAKVSAIVSGAATRAGSVKCGLRALGPGTNHILVHDAARPLINRPMVESLIKVLDKQQAAILAVPVKATIKEVSPKTLNVVRTPRRDLLWEVQTPQGFHRDVLIKAHALKIKSEATDDAMLVEALGVKVQVVMGDYRNIKITTPEDLKLAKALFNEKK